MRMKSVCAKCGSSNIEYLGKDELGIEMCYCNKCESKQESKEVFIETPYERTRRQVYATGNRWAIENFNATH